MILGIYVMRDQRTSYMTPSFDMTDQAAIRNFEAAMSRTESLLHTHPQDFSLYKIGEYDTLTAMISADTPRLLVDGASFKEVTK